MKYILEIRDLSNEGKQIQDVRKDYNINSSNLKTYIELLSNSHVLAIASYLKHTFDEVKKITSNLSVKIQYDSVRLYFFPLRNEIKLVLTTGGYLKSFLYNEEVGFKIEGCNISLSNPINKDYLLLLLKEWENLKKAIDEEIYKSIESQSNQMNKTINELCYTKEILNKFSV